MELVNIRFNRGYSKTVYIKKVVPGTPIKDIVDFALAKAGETEVSVFDYEVTRLQSRAVVRLYTD